MSTKKVIGSSLLIQFFFGQMFLFCHQSSDGATLVEAVIVLLFSIVGHLQDPLWWPVALLSSW